MKLQKKERAGRQACAICRVVVVLALAGAFTGGPRTLHCQVSNSDEYQVKLAFLYNFTKFTEWPAQDFPTPESPFTICVLGTDPFAKELENELRSRTAAGHPVNLIRLDAGGSINSCHVLFVRAEKRKSLATILSKARGRDILTMGEMPGFLEQGGQVNFVFIGQSLHFEVNLNAAEQTRLKFSSKLLRLAINYVPGARSSPTAFHEDAGQR